MQRRTRSMGVIVAGLVACTAAPPAGSGASEPTKAEAPVEAKAEPDAKAVDEKPPEGDGPSRAVLTTVCTTCGGPFARIAAFRDASGTLKRLRYDGDLRRCSHPPRIWFDDRGRETLAIANRPIAVGSPEAEAIMAKQAEQEAGLVEAEAYHCPE